MGYVYFILSFIFWTGLEDASIPFGPIEGKFFLLWTAIVFLRISLDFFFCLVI